MNVRDGKQIFSFRFVKPLFQTICLWTGKKILKIDRFDRVRIFLPLHKPYRWARRYFRFVDAILPAFERRSSNDENFRRKIGIQTRIPWRRVPCPKKPFLRKPCRSFASKRGRIRRKFPTRFFSDSTNFASTREKCRSEIKNLDYRTSIYSSGLLAKKLPDNPLPSIQKWSIRTKFRYL